MPPLFVHTMDAVGRLRRQQAAAQNTMRCTIREICQARIVAQRERRAVLKAEIKRCTAVIKNEEKKKRRLLQACLLPADLHDLHASMAGPDDDPGLLLAAAAPPEADGLLPAAAAPPEADRLLPAA